MDWIIQHLMQNDTIAAAGLTLILSILGAKKVIGKKINTIFSISKETLDVVVVLSKALKPDDDGKIRIDKDELQEIQRELVEMKKALGQVVAMQ
ncbi:hypothetical protein AMJ80_04940 [bacterium SM23_31]|nr:MAG: hypothetical protein AMJ80_04940 [bacterium SM23_31]